MFGQLPIVSLAFCTGLVSLGCGSACPSAGAPSASTTADPNTGVAPSVNNGSPPPAGGSALPVASGTPVAPAAGAPPPGGHEVIDFEAEQAALAPRATGPAKGGPRGTRPCAFYESVDVYQRQCVTKVNADGSVSVIAKGTKLNPDNGFEFTLHGGENSQWVAKGTLNAFARCEGPFVALANLSIDRGVNVYELRFKEHCKIEVR